MSTTSGIASSLLSQLDPTSDSSSNFTKMKQAWQQLSQSLQSGDLDGAKTAFATITQLQQQMQASKSGKAQSQNSQLSSDMKTLAQALQSGDLKGAQTAFAAVQKDMQAMHGHHHHGESSTSATQNQDEVEQLLSSTSTNSVSTYA